MSDLKIVERALVAKNFDIACMVELSGHGYRSSIMAQLFNLSAYMHVQVAMEVDAPVVLRTWKLLGRKHLIPCMYYHSWLLISQTVSPKENRLHM